MVEIIKRLQERGLTTEPAAGTEAIKASEVKLGFALPQEFRDFFLVANGAIGPIGTGSFVKLWPVEELPKHNDGYRVKDFAPGFLLIGSDGCGTAYALDMTASRLTIVEVPFIPLRRREAKTVAHSFEDFLEYLDSWRPE